MGVLDTFYILFKTDSKEAAENTKEFGSEIDTLEKGIGGADKTTVTLGKKFNVLATRAVAAFASVYSVTQLISESKSISEQSSALGLLSEVLGESASELVNWGRAVENMGGDAKAFQSSLIGLSSSLNDALVNGPNAATAALAKMGISSRDSRGEMRTVLEILPELAREFSQLTRESALARGKSLGLDEGTIILLMRGENAVSALVDRQRGMNRVSNDQILQLKLLRSRWLEYKNSLSDIATTILSALVPTLRLVEQGVADFAALIMEHKGPILTFFKGAAVIVGALAVKALILALPFLLTVAAISAVAFAIGLLIEDIQNFVSGQDSALGRAAKRWSFVSDAIELVKTGVSEVSELIESLSSALDELSIPDIFSGVLENAASFIDLLDTDYNTFLRDKLKGVLGSIEVMNTTPISAMGAQISAGKVSSSQNSKSVTIGTLTIETQATNAQEIAETVSEELRGQLSNAVDQTDNGIAA